MKMKKLAGFALAMTLTAGLGLGAQAEEEKTLRVAWSSDMQTMDVHKTTNNYMIPLNVFDRLLEVLLNDDGSTELVNSIASD